MPSESMREWLAAIGLERYAGLFEENRIGADVLQQLTDQDLKDLGIPLGDRKRLLVAIQAGGLRAAPSPVAVEVSQADKPTQQAERRQLTVLFCDLVGFTELASRLDPEVLQGIVRSYEDTCAACVTRYEGYVFQRLGDGIVAFFGYPLAHEGEAERAIRAGLEILKALAKLEVADAGRLEVRIGIASGLVVVASAEKGAVGETMNLAARLQAIAQPGSIVVSERVHRLAGGAFDYEDLGEQTLKGIAHPTHAYRIIGVSEAASRFEAAHAEAGLTPLVGREQELGLLLERWQLAQDGEGQVVLLSGEPGIGKSRILSALRERLEGQRAQALRFQCSPYYVNSALWPSIENFERALKFARDETPESKLDKLEALIVNHYGRPRSDVRFVASMLSISCEERYGAISITPQKHKDETLRTLVDLTEAAARKQPSVMLFEDAHWADPTTLEVLDLLVDRVKGFPLLMALTHRPEFQSRWSQHGHVAALNLTKLTRAQSAAMVSRLTGGKALPDDLLEQILAKTDGVPLFVEELTKSILESGELREAADGYEYSGAARTITIPATLRDSLMARLDRFAPVKEIAQIGAAIGREFSYELIAAVAPMTPAQLDSALTQLTDSGLAFRRGTPPDATYSFKHALVQDAAYDSLLKSRRQQLHERIARTLESSHDIAAQQPELVGHHFAQAGHQDKAARYYEVAGNRACAAMAMAEAINDFTQAIEQLGHLPQAEARDRTEARIRIALGSAFTAHKGWAAPEIEITLRRAYDLALKLDDEDTIIAAQAAMAQTAGALGDFTKGDAIARNLIEAGSTRAHTRMLVVGHAYESWLALATGRLQDAISNYEILLTHFDRQKHGDLVAILNHDALCFAQSWITVAYWLLGRYQEALSVSREQLSAARTIGHPWNLVWSLTGGSDVIAYLGDMRKAVKGIEEAKAICRELHLDFGEHCVCAFHEGLMRIAGRDFARGALAMEQGARLWAAAGGNMHQTHGYTSLAEARAALGQFDEARESLAEATRIMVKTGECFWEAEIHRVRGEIDSLRPGGSVEIAEANFQRALTIARETHAKTWELRAALSLATLWQGQGKHRAARDLLAPVYEWFQEGIETPDLKAARALLDGLR